MHRMVGFSFGKNLLFKKREMIEVFPTLKNVNWREFLPPL